MPDAVAMQQEGVTPPRSCCSIMDMHEYPSCMHIDGHACISVDMHAYPGRCMHIHGYACTADSSTSLIGVLKHLYREHFVTLVYRMGRENWFVQ